MEGIIEATLIKSKNSDDWLAMCVVNENLRHYYTTPEEKVEKFLSKFSLTLPKKDNCIAILKDSSLDGADEKYLAYEETDSSPTTIFLASDLIDSFFNELIDDPDSEENQKPESPTIEPPFKIMIANAWMISNKEGWIIVIQGEGNYDTATYYTSDEKVDAYFAKFDTEKPSKIPYYFVERRADFEDDEYRLYPEEDYQPIRLQLANNLMNAFFGEMIAPTPEDTPPTVQKALVTGTWDKEHLERLSGMARALGIIPVVLPTGTVRAAYFEVLLNDVDFLFMAKRPEEDYNVTDGFFETLMKVASFANVPVYTEVLVKELIIDEILGKEIDLDKNP